MTPLTLEQLALGTQTVNKTGKMWNLEGAAAVATAHKAMILSNINQPLISKATMGTVRE